MPENLNTYMLAVAEGDQDAFRFLARSLGNRIYATALKLLGSYRVHDAEDVTQTVLIKLWQNAPKWQNKGSVEGYVYRLVFSTCMDLHRKHKNNEEFQDNDAITETNVQDDFIHKEIRTKLLQAVYKLPQSQQQAVLLHYFSGYTQNEVATIMNKSEKATESLIIRARSKLKNLLPQALKEEVFYA